MERLLMPTGCVDFEEVRSYNYYYIDKTGIIAQVLREPFKVGLFTRPRRFGKTLTMSTLECFLSIEKKEIAPSLFNGLEIMQDKEVCDRWMNKCPIIFISLKDVRGSNFQNALKKLVSILAPISDNFFKKFKKASQLEELSTPQRTVLETLKNGIAITPEENIIEMSLQVFCQVAHLFYGQKPVLLIDEYDVPLAQAEENHFYSEMIDVIRNMFDNALKDNTDLERAILTGCLRVSKESIFTGLNNPKVYDISTTKFANFFGFTPSEVSKLLSDTGFSSMENTIREWYDGYRFGRKGQEIFCPWDVIQYINELQSDDSVWLATNPPSYWKNSSGNSIIDRIKEEGGHIDVAYVDDLIDGKCISVKLDEQVTYKNLYTYIQKEEEKEEKEEEKEKKEEEKERRRNTLWTVLYMTGYLTLASEEKRAECGIVPNHRESVLVIPNLEIRELFEDIVKPLKQNVNRDNKRAFFDAIWDGKEDVAQDFLLKILLYETSLRTKGKESYYQGLLQGIFIGGGYKTKVEQESGNGYYDLAVTQEDKRLIIETKWAAKGGKQALQSLLNEGITQCKERNYGVDFTNVTRILRYCIAIIGKRCLVKKVEVSYEVSAHKKEFMQS